MTDDPREILRAAGVKVPEVDTLLDDELTRCEYGDEGQQLKHPHYFEMECEPLDAAILALARLVHRYKWQRDDAAAMLVEEHCGPLQWVFEELDRDYAEHMKEEK